ncbi:MULTISPECIES: sensor histidine kinase [Paenibacillus]|uniref:sensor histidine kinase n=1 Tax=Paenibacillus TaxID=44249 RepID=UPI0022B88E0D|nr:HAMP domain-containing sensor histidine kinase [Paenibacillus caseinilyticus]MCZ8520905.1 HAMP domain-containing sensor histidine kinase [Paenibacillus caseinilyticus]
MMHKREGCWFGLQLLALAGLLLTDSWAGFEGAARAASGTVLLVLAVMLLRQGVRRRSGLHGWTVELRRVLAGHGSARLLARGDSVWKEAVFAVNELIGRLAEVQAASVRSEAARKSLLSNISHDIRTPLTSMIGYIDALRDEIAPTREVREEYMDVLSKKACRLKRLVDETFQLAKLDADDQSLTPEPLDLAEQAREALIAWLPELQKHGIEPRLCLPETVCRVLADRFSLERILSNLLENAVRYGREGGVLGLEVDEAAEEYSLRVWDRGPGIGEADLTRIFERTYRGDLSRTSSGGGSGLGLAIARALAEKQGGRIHAQSEPGVRTEFRLTLPRLKPPQAEPPHTQLREC